MIDEATVYDLFRKYLQSQLKFYNSDNIIHVSEIATCLRKAFYNRKFGDEQLSHLDNKKIVILAMGNSIHLALQNVLNGDYSVEKEIEKKHNNITLMGTPDAYNQNHVLEIKSVSKTPSEPYDHHVIQLNAYLGMLNTREGYLIYINKKNGEVKVFKLQFDETLYHQTLERAKKLSKALSENKSPEAETGFLCKYCEWDGQCNTEFSR